METWRQVWRDGFVPIIPLDSLKFLRDAVARDDSRLTQGSTTTPPPLMCVADWPVEAACALGYCGVNEFGGFGTAKVGQVEEIFAKLCFQADQRLGEPAACRHFLNWFDDTPRDEMRREMLAELTLAIEQREKLDVALSSPEPGCSA